MIRLIRVTKEEMQKLRKRFPNLHATRTVHKYYVEERPKVLAYLRESCGARVKHYA